MRKVNGKVVSNLPQYVTANDVKDAINENRPERLVLLKTKSGFNTLDSYRKTYVPNDAELKIVPKRIKAFAFRGYKSEMTKRIIEDQVNVLVEKIFVHGIKIDPDYNWIMIHSYRLPEAWRRNNRVNNVPLLIVIPDEFPALPPSGFYLPDYINPPVGERHLFSPGFGGDHNGESYNIKQKTNQWAWYCSRIDPSAWSPAPIRKLRDWTKGDNLFDVVYLINNVLADPNGD